MGSKKDKKVYKVRFAKNKHRKALKRKDIKYVPDKQFEIIRPPQKLPDYQIKLSGPKNFSLLENRNAVIKYFDDMRKSLEKRIPTLMDLSAISNIDLPTIAFLIAHMMDSRQSVRQSNQYLTVWVPNDQSPISDLFKKSQFYETITRKGIADHGYFLSRSSSKINQNYMLDILEQTKVFVGQQVDISTLAPILTEIFTNTNNHADPNRGDEPNKIPWFVTLLEVPEQNKISYAVVDLGIGIHESLNNKGIKMVEAGRLSTLKMKTFFSKTQSKLLSTSIPQGVRSSTKLLYRGQGLQDIYNSVKIGPYKRFEVLTNKAKVNLLDISGIEDDTEYNLEGTIYYWEIYGQ
jgi:hypothetical protein